MTFTQPPNPSAIDEIANAYVKKWYDEVNNAMKLSEVRQGSYVTTMHPPDTQIAPLSEKESGIVSFRIARDGMISLDNSNIYLEQKIKVTIPAQTESIKIGDNTADRQSSVKWYYIGYRNVGAMIHQYIIHSNNDPIQTKVNPEYEWFLKSISRLEAGAKHDSSDSLLSKINEMNPHVPGVYVNVEDVDKEVTYEDTIRVKLPVTNFLILKDLKWIADWMGLWSIEMTLGFGNLVIVPVIPKEYFTIYPALQTAYSAKNNEDNNTILVNFGYSRLGQPMNNRFYIHTDKNVYFFNTLQTWKLDTDASRTTITGIDTTVFYLLSHVANDLRNAYLNRPLLLPMTTVEYRPFTSHINDLAEVSPTVDAKILYADAVYILFRERSGDSQCFVNPYCNYQLNIDGGKYPSKAFRTVNDLKSINMLYDALNLNNSLLCSVNDDLSNSLQPFKEHKKYDKTTEKFVGEYIWHTGDLSSYILGFPMTDSGIFQGGMSYSGSLALELTRMTAGVPKKCTKLKFGQPVLVTTEDRILAIFSAKPPQTPQVQIWQQTFSEIISG